VSKHLLDAVSRGRCGEVVARLRGGEAVDRTHALGRTATHLAVVRGDLECLATLLTFSPDLAKQDFQGNSCLHLAANSTPVLKKLLSHYGGHGSLVDSRNKAGYTPLHSAVLAANPGACRLLLDAGADVRIKDREGSSPLELARKSAKKDLVSVFSPPDPEPAPATREPAAGPSGVQTNGVRTEGLSVEEEREVLKRRLAELDSEESQEMVNKMRSKEEKLESIKSSYRSRRELARKEIFRLDEEIKRLDSEEKEKCAPLEAEIAHLKSERAAHARSKRRATAPDPDMASVLECPVCLRICKPGMQVWQCLEGHILCGMCKARKEMNTCPVCRVPLTEGTISRNRALEDLARKMFPEEAERSDKAGRQEGNQEGRNKKRNRKKGHRGGD